MTLIEAYQFLELPEKTSQDELAKRYKEKYNFFKMLHTNAPNAIIRNLQEKNLQTLEEIKQFIPGIVNNDTSATGTMNASNPPKSNAASSFNYDERQIKRETNRQEPLAFLVVHTEDKPTVSFPLFEGDNAVGRNLVPEKNTILLSGDIAVSRFHCTVIIKNNYGEMSAAIADDGRFNNGKPSLNGAYYNGNPNRITIQKLNNKDTVQIGMTKLVFKWNTASKNTIEEEVASSEFMGTIVINI
jgi:pSer/pThr/pTyr-binding forkhead associated (FHA) protein